MSFRATNAFSVRQLVCLAASILGLMVLAFAVAPGTVLASTSGVYTEEEVPPAPTKDKTGGKNNGGSTGNNNSGNNNSSNGGGTSGSGGNSSGSGSETETPEKQYSNGQYNPATDSGSNQSTEREQTEPKDDETLSVAPASGGGGDDGGSALPMILAIVIGVPLLGAGGYYLWKRSRGSDDETRDKLKSALGGGSTRT